MLNNKSFSINSFKESVQVAAEYANELIANSYDIKLSDALTKASYKQAEDILVAAWFTEGPHIEEIQEAIVKSGHLSSAQVLSKYSYQLSQLACNIREALYEKFGA